MFTASIKKDKAGFYTEVSKEFTDLYGGAPYHPDLRWDKIPEELNMSPYLQGRLAEIEHKALKTQQPLSTSVSWVTQAGVLKIVTHRQPLKGGGFVTKEIATSADKIYDGWPLLLNQDTQCLQLPNGKRLTRKDLCLLNLFVHNYPRKTMAYDTQTTVKSVEKRLAKVKDILTAEGEKRHSLSLCLIDWRLIPFLLGEHDHFAPKEWMVEHVAHATN